MMNTRKAEFGFTLIELMITVAIVGILAAIAIPQYQLYVAKSQLVRVVAETGSQKAIVEACVADGKLTASATTCAGAATGSNLMSSVGANTANGTAPADPSLGAPVLAFPGTTISATLTATFNDRAVVDLAGKTVTWARSAEGTWTCSTDVPLRMSMAGCPSTASN